MPEDNQALEYIPISYLNAYTYCPRRFYYEFVLGETIVNEHVLEGQVLHKRVDLLGSSTRDEQAQMRHLYLCAPKLGVVGYSDLLEVEGHDTDLTKAAKAGRLFPVEYKKGKMGRWLSDHTQLCVQALALEEALNVTAGSIGVGYIFYIGSARREEVAIDESLRVRALTSIGDARRVAQASHPPVPITNWRKCRDCSLEPLCLPREVIAIQNKKKKVEAKYGNSLFDRATSLGGA